MKNDLPPGYQQPVMFARNRAWIAAALVLLAVTVLSGMLYGAFRDRRLSTAREEQVAQALAMVPRVVGKWTATKDHPLSKTAMDMLNCQAYLYRTYRHRPSGRQVKIAILAGPGETMAVHVPEICLESRNFTRLRDRTEILSASGHDRFWMVPFRVNDASERRVQVLYGWSSRGPWQAPTWPRWTFAAEPLLLKLQLTVVQPIGELPTDTSVASEFLAEFLPVVTPVLAETRVLAQTP